MEYKSLRFESRFWILDPRSIMYKIIYEQNNTDNLMKSILPRVLNKNAVFLAYINLMPLIILWCLVLTSALSHITMKTALKRNGCEYE